MKSKPGNHIDTKELLELAVSLGYHLQMCGAEIFRIEEAVNRLLQAYDTPGDVFVIPHCIIVTVCPDNDEPMTRMRRSYSRGIDVDGSFGFHLFTFIGSTYLFPLSLPRSIS